MPDISKCTGEGCPVRKKCYRFTCPAGEWKSYTAFFDAVKPGSKDGCEFFKAIPAGPLA